jgi:hypothetical protein
VISMQPTGWSAPPGLLEGLHFEHGGFVKGGCRDFDGERYALHILVRDRARAQLRHDPSVPRISPFIRLKEYTESLGGSDSNRAGGVAAPARSERTTNFAFYSPQGVY